ncbi:MAG: zf-HC2 domain-containing protein [Chloroflexi bacterium]|nr:zf-HC2 domain-containing protein [Chloroflexota bacterium]
MSSQQACRDLDALLSAYVDHEATADEMAIVEMHTQSCAACAARLNEYATLVPRLEANVRTVLFEADIAGARVEHAHFRDWTERLNPGALPVRLLSRAATLVVILALALLAAVILERSAPAVQSLAVATDAQPSPPATPSTLNPPTSSSPSAPALVVSVNGLVDPTVAAYLRRAVSAADESHASALVIVLDASGGLDGPRQQVAEALASSSTPTLAFIPPVQGSTADTLLAQSTGLVAAPTTPDVEAFLRSADGQTVQTAAGPVTLATASAPITEFEMDPLEAIGHRLLDPTTAYLLFVLGLFAVLVELAHPGALVPGATGVACLTLASIAFAALPTNGLGVVLIIAAVGLMAVELKAATHGALVLAGAVCLIVGSLLLYAVPGAGPPVHTEVSIAPSVLVATAALGLMGGMLLVRVARQIHALPPVPSPAQLIGTWGTTRSTLDPDGVVHVGGQLWSARVRGRRLDPDQPVCVLARHGLVLEVESATVGAATRKGTLS